MPYQDGLEWVEGLFGLEPRWTKEPDANIITALAQKHLQQEASTPDSAKLSVTFHAQGAFNKLYTITLPNSSQQYMLRASLPVDPQHKTSSEIATIKYVRKETDMPVPGIVAWNADASNELGFEWILMEKMPGDVLGKRWRKMAWEAKETLIRQLARYQAQLFQKRFEGIGNLFLSSTKEVSSTSNNESLREDSFTLGRIVSLIFFWADHLTHDVSRGPFRSNYEWLLARLRFVLADQERILKHSDDEGEIEDAENAKALAMKLLEVLPTIFPPDSIETEPSILFHDDMSMQNILVDKEGGLTAVIDWECVSALPLWRACIFPELLEGRVRDERPSKDDYAPDSNHDDEVNMEASDDALDNEGINELYWDHLLEYERGQLRKVFVDEMQKLQPEWVRIMENNTVKVDFEQAVHNADNGLQCKTVKKWLDDYKAGKVESLREKIIA